MPGSANPPGMLTVGGNFEELRSRVACVLGRDHIDRTLARHLLMWLYLPRSISCRCVPVLEGSTSALSSLSETLEPSSTWKGKQLSRQSWFRALKTAHWTRRL